MYGAPKLAFAVMAAAILVETPDARACSCMGPRVRLLTPDRLDDAPLNTRVRFEAPVRSGSAGAPHRALRVHGLSAEIDVAERTFAAGNVEVIELTPRAQLSPSTRYEVLVVDAAEHPSTLVFGTFQTGTQVDATAPLLKHGGAAEAHKNLSFGGGSCSVAGPWIDVTGADAEDPSRPKAQILWGVWRRDPSGKVDASKPPATIVQGYGGAVTLGRRSLCDPHDFLLPAAGMFWFGVAPLDEAGNAGPMTLHRVDMGAATPGDSPVVSGVRALPVAALALVACRATPPSDVPSIVIAPPRDSPAAGAPPEPHAPRAADGQALELTITGTALCARIGGRVHCGTLADPGRPLSAEPALGGIEDAVSLTAGQGFLCLATKRGTVHCAGDNRLGQLGAHLPDERHEGLVQVAGITDARRVVAGPWHACAVLATGRVACWGRNERGQTGSSVAYGEEARELVAPAEVPEVTAVTSIGAAFSTTCATTAAHDTWCWGEAKLEEHRRSRGAYNDAPATLAELAGVGDLSAGGSAFCGVKEGAITCWGDLWALVPSNTPRSREVTVIPTPRAARRVRVANNHGCAVLQDGAVACFGASYTGALGRAEDVDNADVDGTQPARIVEGLPRVVDVAVGANMSCAVTDGLEVYCWGSFPGAKDRHETTPQRIRITG